MTYGRKRLVTVVSGIALAATLGLVPSSPAMAEPDIDDVQSRVDTLFHEAEQASERYNDARIELDQLRTDLRSLRADEERQDSALSDVRADVRESVLRQSTGTSLGAFGEVVASDDPTAFLSQMSTMSTYNDLQSDLFTDYSTGLKALDLRREATQTRLDRVADTEQQLADEQAAIDDRLAEAESLLDRLEEEEREALLSRDVVERPAADAPADVPADVPADAPASGSAQAAVDYAMAQVGDAYVYGAAGPSAFDCSGLTMMAWGAAGVALPHSSSMQYSSGTRVAASDLQPGDLVFYYSPISHVAIYIGNGMIVGAQNPGTGVVVTGLYSMPYVGAVRPG